MDASVDSFSVIMIIIVVFIEKHIKQKKDVQCQIVKKGLEIFFFPYMRNLKIKKAGQGPTCKKRFIHLFRSRFRPRIWYVTKRTIVYVSANKII